MAFAPVWQPLEDAKSFLADAQRVVHASVPKVLLEHLLKRADFLAVAKAGKRYVTPAFILQAYPQHSSDTIRFGIVVTKKIGNAVVRNRGKRRLRALAKACLNAHGHPGCDYVLVARDEILTRDFSKMLKELEKALGKTHEDLSFGFNT